MTRFAWVLGLLVSVNAYADKSAIAVIDIQGTGVSPELLPTLTEVLTAEIDALGMYKVVAGRDVQAMLGFEKQKDMMGCTDAACLAEIGGALGVDRIVVSQIGMVGKTYVVNIKIINIRMADTEGRVYETVKDEVDALIETIRKSVQKLLGSGSKAALATGASVKPAPKAEPKAEPKPEPKVEAKPAETVAQGPAESTPSVSASGSKSSIGWLPITLWSAGGVTAAIAVFFGVSAKKYQDEANAKWPGDATGSTYDVGAQNDAQMAENRAKAANITFLVSGLLVGGGVAAWLLGGSSNAPVATALAPVVTPDSVGFAFGGSF